MKCFCVYQLKTLRETIFVQQWFFFDPGRGFLGIEGRGNYDFMISWLLIQSGKDFAKRLRRNCFEGKFSSRKKSFHTVHFKLIINYPFNIVLIGRWSAPLSWYYRSCACTCSANHGCIQTTSGWSEVRRRIHFTNCNVVKTSLKLYTGRIRTGDHFVKVRYYFSLC